MNDGAARGWMDKPNQVAPVVAVLDWGDGALAYE
jgi:hypothetical protein